MFIICFIIIESQYHNYSAQANSQNGLLQLVSESYIEDLSNYFNGMTPNRLSYLDDFSIFYQEFLGSLQDILMMSFFDFLSVDSKLSQAFKNKCVAILFICLLKIRVYKLFILLLNKKKKYDICGLKLLKIMLQTLFCYGMKTKYLGFCWRDWRRFF